MTAVARRFDLGRWSVALAVAVVLLSIFFRQFYLRSAPFNEDEIDGLHVSWEISRGSELYIHMWDARAPLTFYINSLLLRFAQQDENVVVQIRCLYQIAVAIALILIFIAIRSFADTASAMLTCALMAACSFFVSRTTQVRADVLMFMFFAAAFWAFINFKISEKRYWLVAAGSMFALSALCKHVGLFPFIAAATYLLVEMRGVGSARREVIRNLSILILSFVIAAVITMVIMFGPYVAQALESFFAEPLLLKYSEGLRRQDAKILPEIIANLPFLILGLGTWIAIQCRIFRTSQDQSRWHERFIIINSYFAILYLVARGQIFQQDLIIPAFVLAWTTGYFHTDILAWIRSRKGGFLTLAVVYFLIGVFPLFYSRWHHNWDTRESVRWNRKVHTEFIQACGIDKGDDPGIEKLALLYSGHYGDVDHLPGRWQWQQRLLMAKAILETESDEFVLSEDDMPIFRPMSHTTVRAEQFGNLLHLVEGQKNAPRFSNLCHVEPLLCDTGLKPEMRLIRILEKKQPGLIILGYELAQVLFSYESVKTWLSARYRFYFDDETLTWMASPVG